MNNLKDKKYLRWNIQRGISWIHSRGYEWFTKRYLTSIKNLEQPPKKNSDDKFLLSDAYYCVGDVHDFNDAPLTAIKAYKKRKICLSERM